MRKTEKKAAVLTECMRLCQCVGDTHEFEWGTLDLAGYKRIGDVFHFRAVGISIGASEGVPSDSGIWPMAYALLGLPKEDKWERLKTELSAAKEKTLEVAELIDNTTQTRMTTAEATIYMCNFVERMMTQIEQGAGV